MKKKLFIAAILLFSALHCFAFNQYNNLWVRGNDYYRQKQYDSAAYYFEQIAGLQPREAMVYYNLGNAYYRLNNIGAAVLNYERALRIDPAFKEAQDNLALTQGRINNRINYSSDIFFIKWWHALTRAGIANVWALAGLFLFLVILGILWYSRWRKPAFSFLPQVIGVLSVLWIALLVLAFTAAGNNLQSRNAVVMQNDTPLMNSQQQGKPLSLVPEGTKVELKKEQNNWAEIRLPDGRDGWVQQASITKI